MPPTDLPDPRVDAVNRALNLARSYRRRGHSAAAWRAADDALAMAPEEPAVLELMGELNLDSEFWEAAEQCFRRVLDLDPRRASAEVGLGKALVGLQQETVVQHPTATDRTAQRRTPSTAAALSFLVPGLGQAYADALERGIAAFLIALPLWGAVAWQYTALLGRSGGGQRVAIGLKVPPGPLFWGTVLLGLVWNCLAAWDAYRQQRLARGEG
ncbi:MAG: hypothetical protein IT204_15965 [Fimbriimonadaceae bacterium]|nr:hypothetical protein [Fimbriimonadaceae bacterium]